jgi:hypothetical protein
MRTGWTIRPTPPVPLSPGWCYAAEPDAPDAVPLLEPDGGGVPDSGGGVPLWDAEPLPMFGQFLVEPEPEPEPELLLFELDEGVVVEEPDVEFVPEFPVVEVVAALATSAPPPISPEVSAPTATTLRKRMCMAVVPLCLCCTGPV